jgi:hypothetical protein
LTPVRPQINFLIIFTIGLTAFGSFLDAFKQPTSVLTVVASKFPAGATFFVSYMMLQAGIQMGVETSLLGIGAFSRLSFVAIVLLQATR